MITTNSVLYITAFLAIILFFGWIAFRTPWKVDSVQDFFHFDSPKHNLISLVVSNITVGTGLAYLLTSGHQNGLLMLIVPLAFIAGYYLLNRFIIDVVPHEITQHGNFFSAIQKRIELLQQRKSILPWVVVTPLIIIYILIFAYEIFVTSQILSGLMFNDGTTSHQITISAILFIASLIYCYLAGVRAVFRTDKVQIAAIFLFLITLGLAAFHHSTGVNVAGSIEPGIILKLDQQTLINVLLASIAAISTQFYSLMNWYTVSNLRQDDQRSKVLQQTALLLALVFAGIILIGATTALNWETGLSGAISTLYSNFDQSPLLFALLNITLIIGFSAIILSTIDTLMISLTMYTHDSLPHHQQRQAATPKSQLQFVRHLMLGLFILAFIALSAMFYGEPNIFYLLLSIASGASVFAPFVITMGYLARTGERLQVVTTPYLTGYFLLFLSTLATTLWLTTNHGHLVPYISLIHFTLSIALSISLWKASITVETTN